MKKLKIAIVASYLNVNGISSVIMNFLSNIDLQPFEFTVIAGKPISPIYVDECNKLGIKIIELPNRRKYPFNYLKKLSKVFSENLFDVVHVHGNSSTICLELNIAKRKKISKRIAHSHNTTCNHKILNRLLYPFFKKSYTVGIACSEAAGKWLFRNNSFDILNNGINLSKYAFNETTRQLCRDKIGAGNRFVIGHVGNFVEQKNHSFLLEVFYTLVLKECDCLLVLIGDGSLKKETESKVNALGLNDKVIFVGKTPDVEKYLQAMDLFILPSLFEGLPVSMIEAQAAALPLLVSDNVTQTAKCTERVFYKDLADGAQSWAQAIQDIKIRNYDRFYDVAGDIRAKGFDIKNEAEKLSKIYLK